MPLSPDEPHRFTPLDVTGRSPKALRTWLHFNRAITPESMPCTVCGASERQPVHFDPRERVVTGRTISSQ